MAHAVQCGSVHYEFGESGMLQVLALSDGGNHNLIRNGMSFTLTLAGGKKLVPVSAGKAEMWTTRSGSSILEFTDLHWAEPNGTEYPGFRLTLRYEFYPDGTAFTDAFFLGEMNEKEDICGFELSIPLDFSAFQTTRWSIAYRPKKTDGALIQTSAPERNLPPGTDRIMEQSIWPLAGFNLWKENGPSCYMEFFMEGDNVLAGDSTCNRSSVIWENGNPVLHWNFQTKPVHPASGPWQWRNRWGWVAVSAPRTRHFPPLPMYHFFDNFRRYPSDETLNAIAQAGIEVLILHENWRTDVQNGGQPYDPARFKQIVDFAHKHNIRIMVYIRGNEDSVLEEQADWFDHYLKKDYDGLYMDYGGPFHNQTPPDESFQGGRIHFRNHYLANRMRRSIVGKNGLLYSHTGPMFSALGMTGGNADGYVSGEGERGMLVRSRLDHAYFSMAAVASGTMWTAAFPEYSTQVMVPYLAATGQTPHVPLGTQFPSSSLAHPPVPGIGDIVFRPLWKLWQLMQGTADLQIWNDYNCSGIFVRSEPVAHYLMVSKNRAVCIFANLTDRSVCADSKIDLAAVGIPVCWKQSLCQPDIHTPGKVLSCSGGVIELPPRGIAALVFGEADFAKYEKPYPELSSSGKAYMQYVEEQRRFRQGLGKATDWKIRVRVQDLPVPYEESMIVDLYDNRFELNEVRNGKTIPLGYLGRKGFQKEETQQEDFVMNGTCSPWISLKQILGPGHHELVIRSLHRGDLYYVNTPFYSFLELDEAREDEKPLCCIRFLNELEPDRSQFHFSVDLQ